MEQRYNKHTVLRNYSIYKLFCEGFTAQSIAQKYGVGKTCVENMVSKLRDMENFYGHVGGHFGFTDEVKTALWATCSCDKTTNGLIRLARRLKQYDLAYYKPENGKCVPADKQFILDIDEELFGYLSGVGTGTMAALKKLKKFLREESK